MTEPTEITTGSGNVFEDIGFEPGEAAELQAKAELTRRIYHLLRERGLSQRAAAKLLGIAQPDVAALMKGRHTGFSIERLAALLTRLDQDVDIIVRPKAHERGRLSVKAS